MDQAKQFSDADLERVLRERAADRGTELDVEEDAARESPWRACFRNTRIWGDGPTRRQALEELFREVAQADTLGDP